MALWPGGARRPAPRSVSNRRTGPAVALDDGLRSDHVPPGCASEPRQSTVNTPSAAVLRPCVGLDTARRRPARPGSSYIGAQTGLRAAIDPPAYPESAARRAPVARSARLRPVRSALPPPVGPPISARSGAIRPSACLRGPCRRLSGPPAAAQAAPAAACADPSGTPGTHTPAPRSVPGGGRDAHTHIWPRVRRGIFRKEIRERRLCGYRPGGTELTSGQERAWYGVPGATVAPAPSSSP